MQKQDQGQGFDRGFGLLVSRNQGDRRGGFGSGIRVWSVTQGGDFLDMGHQRFGVGVGVGCGWQTCSLGIGSLTGHIMTEVISSNLLLSSRARNSISKMTKGKCNSPE